MRVYLSGAIEYAPDHGRAWRAAVTPFLESLGHVAYDPALDEKKNLSEEERRHFREWKSTDLPRFQQTVRKIIAYDLDYIELKTDFILCYWDQYSQRGAGTQAELTVAFRMGLPVYLVAGMPLSDVSGWILGCSTQVFTNFEDLKSFMQTELAAAKNNR